jgi:dethiobiotin synthetase
MDMAGLALSLGLPLLVVARPGLGTLNHTFLTVRYARSRGLAVIGVVLSGGRGPEADTAERTNPEWIEAMCDAPVLGIVPERDGLDDPAAAADALRGALDPTAVLDYATGD